MSDALGVGALMESSDGQVVLMKRAEHLAEAPGLWDIPGGHPEPKVIVHFLSTTVTTVVSKCCLTT